jgi:pre-mRNA-splicing factor CWC26
MCGRTMPSPRTAVGGGGVTVAATESEGTTHCRNSTPSSELGGKARADLLLPQQRQRRDAPSCQATLSPKRNGVAEQGDLSPPRKSRQQVDLSPPRRRAHHDDSEESHDLSPPQRRVRHDSVEPQDLSPLR